MKCFLEFADSVHLRNVFPELSDKQFQVGMYYALGLTSHHISMLTDIRYEAIKKNLQRCKEALDLDHLELIRSIFLVRLLGSVYLQRHRVDEAAASS